MIPHHQSRIDRRSNRLWSTRSCIEYFDVLDMSRSIDSAWSLSGLILLSSMGCGRIDYIPRDRTLDASSDAMIQDGSLPQPDAGPLPETLSVEPTYPSHGAWNAYVQPTDSAADHDHQPEVSCPSLDTVNGVPCIHGGERRRVETTHGSCEELSLEDDQGAFRWRCDARSGRAVFYSQGLMQGRGLGDLIDAGGASWRALHVTLMERGVPIETSAPTVWWSNSIKPLPTDGSALTNDSSDIGDIFVAATDRTVMGLVITSDRVALVTLPNATVSFEPSTPQNCSSTAGGAIDSRCLVLAEGRSFLWIEGSFRGVRSTADLRGLLLRQLRNSRVRRIQVRDTGSHGIELQSVYESRFEDIRQENSGERGVSVDIVSHNRFIGLRLAHNARESFYMRGTFGRTSAIDLSSHNIVHDLHVSNSGSRGGSVVCGTRDNVFTKIISSSNGGDGFYVVCTDASTISHITSIASASTALVIDQSTRNVVAQAIAAASRTGLGLYVGPTTGRYVDIVATDNVDRGVDCDSGLTTFHGVLMVGNNGGGDCSVSGRFTTPGVVDGTCTISGADGSSDYGAQASTAILRTGRSLLDAFRGRLIVDDPANGSDLMGFATTPTDWLNFESPYRAWGRDALFAAERGRCTGNCRIWDWRLSPTDNQLRDRSGDGSTPIPPTPGAMCPAWLRGDVALVDWVAPEILGDGVGNDDGLCWSGESCGPPSTFLIHALEIVGDGIGDEDGLCESHETCVASPHFGAWQGDGEPVGSCVFDPGPGSITDVIMLVR